MRTTVKNTDLCISDEDVPVFRMNYTSTMRFIELFRQYRALWDRNDVDYLNKAERMRQRELIGYTMGMTGESSVCHNLE